MLISFLNSLRKTPARLNQLATSVDHVASSSDYNLQAIIELQKRLDKLEDFLADTPQAMRQLQLRHEADHRQLRADWRATIFTQQQALLGAARALAGTALAPVKSTEFGPAMSSLTMCAEPELAHPCQILLPEALDAKARTAQSTWLDLGCGIGGWLQELVAAGISPHGIDHRETPVAVAQGRGVAAQVGNELQFLEAAAPASLAGVSAFHLIERLAPDTVPKLIEAAWLALVPGGVLMLSGANPENLVVALFGLWQAPERTRLWLPQTLTEATVAKGYTHQRVIRWSMTPEKSLLITENQATPEYLQPHTDSTQFIDQACNAPENWTLIARKPV